MFSSDTKRYFQANIAFIERKYSNNNCALARAQIENYYHNLGIFLKKDDNICEIPINPAIRNNLLTLLKAKKQLPEKFCCMDFVNFLYGKYRDLNKLSFSDWNIEYLTDINTLLPEQVFMISRSANPELFTHFAVYLGQGKYLSQFNNSGPVLITDIDAFFWAYDGDYLFRLTAKEQPDKQEYQS